MAENVADLGYVAVKEETTGGTPVIPNLYIPLYEEDLTTNINLDEDMPIIGNKAARWQMVQGQRDHQGTLGLMAEPNTALYILSMLMKRGSVTGTGPYTWPFTMTDITNSFTLDVVKGRSVFRFWGLRAKSLKVSFDDNKAQFDLAVSALGSLTARKITSVVTNTLTLDTAYDPVPTKGFIATDLVRIFKADGSVQDTTVSSVTNTTVVVAAAGGAAANDFIVLRPASPSYTLQPPFQWARTEYRFGATAAAALSATHTPMEEGSDWTLLHNFQKDEGEKRSGSYDPAALIHTRMDAEVKTKHFFDNPGDYSNFVSVQKRALVIRMFNAAISGTDQELRITLNNLKGTESKPPLKTAEVVYQEMTWKPQYDTADAAFMSVTLLNNLASF